MQKRGLKILVVGDGGREQALVLFLEQSPRVLQVLCVAAGKTNILGFCKAREIDFVVIGPEAPLVAGLVDELKKAGVPAFGPSKLAAELEGSKIFMKTRCRRWGIPTADFDFAGSYPVAERAIKNNGFRVIKADGLCGGKGVTIADSEPEALDAAREMLDGKVHSKAGARIVMEERLEGEECSVMALCDGVEARVLAPARDYKRLCAGSNIMTGGVGAYSPLLDLDEDTLKDIKVNIVDKLLVGMAKEGRLYQGTLYSGIMLTKSGPKLLEVNCRFGDPETQVILPRLKTDIVPYLFACIKQGGLTGLPPLVWDKRAAVCVVLFSPEYPASGRRLQSVVRLGPTVAAARDKVYTDLAEMQPNAKFRDDIGADV